MSRIFYILVAFCTLFSISEMEAQTISLGERTPRVKKVKWLDGNVPEKREFTYIEFIYSASVTCRNTAEHVYNILNELGNTTFILISHQNADDVDPWVKGVVGPYSGVIVEDNHIRSSYGVNYAPYAVILDHKRRALWFGNPQLLDRKYIEHILWHLQK